MTKDKKKKLIAFYPVAVACGCVCHALLVRMELNVEHLCSLDVGQTLDSPFDCVCVRFTKFPAVIKLPIISHVL